jgi:alcohol dehydrogenase (cytochrome c)
MGRLPGAPAEPADADQSAHDLAPCAEWVRQFPGTGDLETVPLVQQGVMYATIPNEVFALDAVTGREIWHYANPGARRAGVNRGVAMLGDRVYFATSDCHLVALRRTRGAVIWGRAYANSPDSCTAAPLAVKDKIVVAVASSGKTCFIAAISAETGTRHGECGPFRGRASRGRQGPSRMAIKFRVDVICLHDGGEQH